MRNFDKKFLALLVVILTVSALFLTKGWWRGRGENSSYKSVLLTNKAAYFGKVKNSNADFVTLSDVFYLRLSPSGAETAGGGLELAKLGSEIFGPEDTMAINRKQIVSIESLKEDSQVVRAIRGYYLGQGRAK